MKGHEPFRGQMSDSFRAAVFIVLSGGFQDAYTYTCRGGVFANAQTGNIVLLSTALFRQEWPAALKYLIPVLSFVVGTAVAEGIHLRLKSCEKIHWRQIILLVSFVCAMQVQTFHKVRGHAYASTMCIGNLRSGTEALCAYFRVRDKEILQKAATYLGVVLVFGVGAGLGSILTVALDCRAIWLCCLLLSVSFGMMFIHEK